MRHLLVLFAAVIILSGCAEVGSESWCADLKQKPSADWSANEAADYAKHCVF
ncbi:MAG: DUF3012 domain-containing protein [Motiliproteus sp.]